MSEIIGLKSCGFNKLIRKLSIKWGVDYGDAEEIVEKMCLGSLSEFGERIKFAGIVYAPPIVSSSGQSKCAQHWRIYGQWGFWTADEDGVFYFVVGDQGTGRMEMDWGEVAAKKIGATYEDDFISVMVAMKTYIGLVSPVTIVLRQPLYRCNKGDCQYYARLCPNGGPCPKLGDADTCRNADAQADALFYSAITDNNEVPISEKCNIIDFLRSTKEVPHS